MNEEQLYRWLMITTATLAALCGLGAVSLIVLCAMSFSLGVLLCAVLMAAGAVSCGYATLFFSQKTTVPKVFNNQDEKEVLTNRQRRELRRKRGEVVMERALIEVEHEHQNIVHNLQNEANDPSLPPYKTRWSNGANVLPPAKKHRHDDDEEESWGR